MNFTKIKKFRDILIPLVTFGAIVSISALIIAYGRGYRLDIIQKQVSPTGLIAATSDPTGAQILVNGKLESATNNTLSVDPGWYTVAIAKEGFQTWEKSLRVQGEVVTRADAYLFPTNPSLSAVTTNGVVNPSTSPDGGKLAFVIPEAVNSTSSATTLATRPGIWVLDMTNRPLGLNRDAQQIAKSSYYDFSNAILNWSPDSKQIVASVQNPITNKPAYYLLETDKLNDTPKRIFDTDIISLEWEVIRKIKEQEKLSILKPEASSVLTPLINILSFSPEETKILYEATQSASIPKIISPELIGTNPTEEVRDVEPGNIYVYDIKEDRNYLLGTMSDFSVIPQPTPTVIDIDEDLDIQNPYLLDSFLPPLPIQWLPTDRHLMIVSKDKIEAVDYDNTNKKTLYSGPFEANFVVPWSNASKILVMTTLNPAASDYPNLYAVNLR
ncbi:PEGA domain-containing protein [Patescibacteria group bacterium]